MNSAASFFQWLWQAFILQKVEKSKNHLETTYSAVAKMTAAADGKCFALFLPSVTKLMSFLPPFRHGLGFPYLNIHLKL